MRHPGTLISSILLITILFITCTEEPAGPDISDDLKPKGNIVGWVYDMWNRPIKDVLVSVNADSAVPGLSKSDGQFFVGKVQKGTYVLRFTHRDYEDNPTCTVSVEQGVDDTLKEPVKLSYAYYIVKGLITINGLPQSGAGVCVADYTEGMLTGSDGVFTLPKVPKNNSVKLICAYGNVAVQTKEIAGLVANDTNDVGTIQLTEKGPTVSGRVFYPDLKPAPNIIVFAVAGGIKTSTDKDGYYVLRNVPANEDGVVIMVDEGGYVGAAIGANAVNGAVITGCDIYLRPAQEIINGMKLVTCDVYVPSTASSVIVRVYPVTGINTVIKEYHWSIGASSYITANPACTVSVSGLSPKTTASVSAISTVNDTSKTEQFFIFLTGTAPVIDSISVSKDKKTYSSAVTIQEGEWAWFYVHVTDLVGGLKTMQWDLGDGSTWTTADTNPNVGHMYSTAGTYHAVFTAKDADNNTTSDSVTVTVQKSPLQPVTLIFPDSGATVYIPNDTIPLRWTKSSGTGIVYNAYMTWSSTIPSEENIVASGIADSLYKAKVDSGKTYFWRVKAIRTGDSASVWSTVFCFTVYANVVNHAPVFITTADSMTDTMYAEANYKDTLKAFDADGDKLTFSFIDSVSGMTLSKSAFCWTPALKDTGKDTVSVKVSDNKGATDTLTWKITVINGAPVITIHPVSKTANENDSVKFAVSAKGDSLKYQWQKNNADIAGATDSIFKKDSVILADSGYYRCIVLNSFGKDTSDTAKLTVKPYVSSIIYVKADATGSNNGKTWADAFTSLQTALDSVKANMQIWVAAGTYKPSKEQGGAGERFKSFSMKSCVGIYGGFAGTETQLEQRDWEKNVTICSGDIGVEGDSTDNCYHVFYNPQELILDNNAVLNGVIIEKGMAIGGWNCGAGMLNNLGCSPTIKNCTFRNNNADHGGAIYNNISNSYIDSCTFSNNRAAGGGAIKNYKSAPKIFNCYFVNNKTTSRGSGGAISSYGSSAYIKNCNISDNRAQNGGGVYLDSSNGEIVNCRFEKNSGEGTAIGQDGIFGGGIYLCKQSCPIIRECTFLSNTALGGYQGYGGAIFTTNSLPKIDGCTFTGNSDIALYINNGGTCLNNCTFVNNSSNSYAGGIFLNNGTVKARIVNCTFLVNQGRQAGAIYMFDDNVKYIFNSIFWNNYATEGGNDINGSLSKLYVLYSIIKDSVINGIKIIKDDPKCLPVNNNGGSVETCALYDGSPAIDTGIFVYEDDNDSLFYNLDCGDTYLDIYGNPFTPVGAITKLTTNDARGVLRPQRNRIDLGAYEKE